VTQPISYPLPPPPSIYEPPPVLVDFQRNQPVTKVVMADGVEAYLVSRYADVRQILVDRRFSRAAVKDPGGPAKELGELETESLIGMDPPEHTRLRKLVSYAFTPRRVEELRPRIAELVAELLDTMLAGPGPVDLVEGFSTPLPVAVISELFGIPPEDRHKCKEWSDTMMGDWQVDPEGTAAAVRGFSDLIDSRRAHPGNDLLTALLKVNVDQDRLSDHELLMVSIGVMIGGHETTTTQINLFVLTLLRFPEQLAALQADPSKIPAAVEELSRFIQLGETGVMLPRVTTEPVELGGTQIPAGATVLPAFMVANRDPAMFTEPDGLDLNRPANPHLAFGAGVHHCLGAQLARVELQEALKGLLQRMPNLRLAVAESELRYTQGLVVRRLEELPLWW
jgi:cytochrome P450